MYPIIHQNYFIQKDVFRKKLCTPYLYIHCSKFYIESHDPKNCFYTNWCKDMHIYRHTQTFLHIFLKKTCNKNTELLHPMIYQKKRYKAQKTPKIRGKEI